MNPRRVAALALPFVFIFAGCLFPYAVAVNSDPDVHPGWKCPQGIKLVSAVPLPPCAWIEGGLIFDSCRKQTEAAAVDKVYEENGCIPDPTTAPTCAALVPPMDDQRRLNPMAPLSQWKVFAAFPTLDQCNSALASDKRAAKGSEAAMLNITHPVEDSREAFNATALPFAQCVKNDDPRLKQN